MALFSIKDIFVIVVMEEDIYKNIDKYNHKDSIYKIILNIYKLLIIIFNNHKNKK